MGHRNSSAQLHDAGCFCFDRSGAARVAAEPSAAKVKPLEVAAPGAGLQAASGASRAAVWFLLACIRFYQAVFAPWMPLGCKFYPSCSRYAAEAIARYGTMQGTGLALARLWRCRPFTQGGVDPVPDPAELLSNTAGDEARSEVRP